MPDNPNNASDEFSEVTYDLVMWLPDYREWMPRGYDDTWEHIKLRYQAKLQQTRLPIRVVLVEKTTKHTDLTDQIREELSL
jgi:hypothetical protein